MGRCSGSGKIVQHWGRVNIVCPEPGCNFRWWGVTFSTPSDVFPEHDTEPIPSPSVDYDEDD